MSILFDNPIWLGIHEQDCRYSKFRHLINLAVKYGLSFEGYDALNPNAAVKDSPKIIKSYRPCFDVAIAREYGLYIRKSKSICGASSMDKPRDGLDFVFQGSKGSFVLGEIRPVFRSTYGIFNFLGRLITSGKTQIVTTPPPNSLEEESSQIIAVTEGISSCFAEANYLGRQYCVPARGTENTKAAFSILATLIALRTEPKDLPNTTAIVLRP